MRQTLLTTTVAVCLMVVLPAFGQTATDPNPANPSAIKDGNPAAGTGSGSAPANDPVTANKTGAMLGKRTPRNDPGPLGNTVDPASSGQEAPATTGPGITTSRGTAGSAAPRR